MTDKDVQREIEANERRAREHEERDVDEGGLPGAIEDLLDPFDQNDDDDSADDRELNDADQRRGEREGTRPPSLRVAELAGSAMHLPCHPERRCAAPESKDLLRSVHDA